MYDQNPSENHEDEVEPEFVFGELETTREELSTEEGCTGEEDCEMGVRLFFVAALAKSMTACERDEQK